jgi:DNA-binding transcriptional MerR regulator
MRIGELAELAGTSPRALRHYEAQGLLTARRATNGYREYDEADVRLVAEIRSLLAIGFTLEDTRPFLDCLRAGHATGDACPASVAVLERKLAEIDNYLGRLRDVRAQLVHAINRGKHRDEEDPCPCQQRPADLGLPSPTRPGPPTSC